MKKFLNSNYVTDSYIKNGFCLIENINKDKMFLINLRDELEKIYKNNNFARTIWAHEIENEFINLFIYQFLSCISIKKFLKEIENKVSPDNEVTIFPPFEFTRNFFSSPQEGNHGWHIDAGGEYRFKECSKYLNSDNYVFGKLQVAFQPNTSYGGNIDITQYKFKESMNRPLREKLSIKIQELFLNISKRILKTNNIYFNDIYISDIFSLLMNPISISTDPLSVFAFDSRIMHRGTPLKPRIYSKLKKKYKKFNFHKNTLPSNVTLGTNNKYVFYCHFGNKLGLSSYMHERFRRDSASSEIIAWRNQLDNLNLYKKNFPNAKDIFYDCFEEFKSKSNLKIDR